MFSNFKIKTQMRLLLGGTIIVIIVSMTFFYFHMYKLIESKNQINVNNIMQQFKDNIQITTKNIMRIGSTIAYDKYVQEYLTTDSRNRRMELNIYINNLINSIVDLNSDIMSITLINEQGKDNTFLTDNKIDEYQIITTLNNQINTGKLAVPNFFSFPKNSFKNNTSYYCYAIPSYSLSIGISAQTRVGIIYILCKTDSFTKSISKLNLSKGNRFMILDEKNRVLVSNGDGSLGTIIDIDKIQKEKLIIYTQEIENPNWKIVSGESESELSKDLKSVVIIVFLICGIIVILLISISFVHSRSVTIPLNKMVNAIVGIGEKNIKQRMEVEVNNELGVITNSVNLMLDKIEEMTKHIFNTQKKLYEMENRKNIALLTGLQSQINPHFLYNTLECIRSIATVYNSKEIINISTAMANIFRYSIKNSHFVKVHDEIFIIKEYLRIMNVRFQGKYETIYDIEENLMDHAMIKMILQPIIENAVCHGLEKKYTSGLLKLSAVQEGQNMVFYVEDNGVGIEPDKLNELIEEINMEEEEENRNGIGLRNVNKRIKLHYGNGYGVSIDSIFGIGTIVKIIIPLN